MYVPIKSLGQSFLVDNFLAKEMVNSLDISDGDEIIEIGPGQGMLTDIIAIKIKGTGSSLDAVEIDKRLVEQLVPRYGGNPNVKIIHSDILSWLNSFVPDREFKIIGSLPYYITSPIIHGIIKMKKRPVKCVLLIQKEVAEKIKSVVPDSSYMSCLVQTFFDVKYVGKVPKNRFRPIPAVDGGIIKLTRKEGDFSLDFIDKYEGFLHKAFSSPRKMLNKVFSKEELQKGGVEPTLRGQNLRADDWLSFYKILHQGKL